jgi:hypothetical protein
MYRGKYCWITTPITLIGHKVKSRKNFCREIMFLLYTRQITEYAKIHTAQILIYESQGPRTYSRSGVITKSLCTKTSIPIIAIIARTGTPQVNFRRISLLNSCHIPQTEKIKRIYIGVERFRNIK